MKRETNKAQIDDLKAPIFPPQLALEGYCRDRVPRPWSFGGFIHTHICFYMNHLGLLQAQASTFYQTHLGTYSLPMLSLWKHQSSAVSFFT